MLRLVLSAIALVIFLPVARAAEAEPGSVSAVAMMPQVQKALELSEAQVSKIAKAKTEAEALAAIKPAQATRLKEISIQARGGSAIVDESVAKELKLTPEQKTAITKIWTNKELDLQMKLKVARFRTPAIRVTYILGNRKESGEAIIGVLTDEQKKTFTAMQGKPFKFGK